MEVYKNKPTAGLVGDVLFNQSVYGTDASLNKQEFTRITHTIRDATSGGEDGSIEMGCFVNGTYANFLQLNAVENEINSLKPIDMVGNNIRSSTGSMTITTALSAGLGNITLVAKAGANINFDSNVLMDNSETFTQRNAGNTISNTQNHQQINMIDNTNLNNTNQNLLANNAETLINDQTLLTSRIYRNEKNANASIIGEYDTSLATDIKKLTMNTNLITMNDSNALPTIEQVDITPVSIQFTSSGSASDILSMYNDSADGGEIDWSNTSGTNGLAITSSHSLTIKATAATFPLQFNSDVINLVNTNTAASTANNFGTLATTGAIGDITNYLKLQLNGSNIWIPYFTSDPSV